MVYHSTYSFFSNQMEQHSLCPHAMKLSKIQGIHFYLLSCFLFFLIFIYSGCFIVLIQFASDAAKLVCWIFFPNKYNSLNYIIIVVEGKLECILCHKITTVNTSDELVPDFLLARSLKDSLLHENVLAKPETCSMYYSYSQSHSIFLQVKRSW